VFARLTPRLKGSRSSVDAVISGLAKCEDVSVADQLDLQRLEPDGFGVYCVREVSAAVEAAKAARPAG
jgi:hypothetical protein